MLDVETRRRIDTARDLLVGKVPDPKSQVEQITIALIYKFMDDMDAESEELGGSRTFFAGDFARFGWGKLMRPGLGGHETVDLYTEAIQRMAENPGAPSLFRDIFKNAYLPYRDSETLRRFLKVIHEFTYDHSERLGDAFEYLLSVLGSQGDAGQFRTPRHIIDFVVAVLDPKKNETILDPACGTAGFLVSSYKHILGANLDTDGHSALTPDERASLAKNFRGYDISPDMVRLSLVNMYLHGFARPQIVEYDTLTNEDRWTEYADVIFANPPFMSPKGGIRPHSRFSSKSRRSEVLFVDYIAEHLTPNGRAGIIVPEGVMFQTKTAYKRLRKMLVEDYLVAVVSLPPGVFQPYSGVKTSILILDRRLSKRAERIAFFTVENDGFDLGAQRRPVEKNDLPEVQKGLREYLGLLRARRPQGQLSTQAGFLVESAGIASTEDWGLSGGRYREKDVVESAFPLVSIGDPELFDVIGGGTPRSGVEEYWGGGVPWATLVDVPATGFVNEIRATRRTISERGLSKSSAKLIPENSVVVSTRATIGRIAINRTRLATNQGFKSVVIKEPSRVLAEYLAFALTRLVPEMQASASGGTFKEISKSRFCQLKIPLPPLHTQRRIVLELTGYQQVIEGALKVKLSWKPTVAIRCTWPTRRLGELFAKAGATIDPRRMTGKCMHVGLENIEPGSGVLTGKLVEDFANIGSSKTPFEKGQILFGKLRPNLNKVHVASRDGICSTDIYVLECGEGVDPEFYAYLLRSPSINQAIVAGVTGAQLPRVSWSFMKAIELPFPPLEVQRRIASELAAEEDAVAGCRRLIDSQETRIRARVAALWSGAG